MINKDLNKYANKIVHAFLKNKLIAPLPSKYTKKISEAQKLRKLCESKIKKPIAGFKAAGTGIPVLKKLKEKEPFYASVYQHNILKNNKSVKINKYTMGIELEVCYLIKKSFFNSKKKITVNNIKKFKNNNVKNLKTNIFNKKIKQSVNGNTNTVYINPMNSLRFVLNKLQKDKIKLKDEFYVFTGSSVGVVPILGKGIYKGTINKVGSVSSRIN